MSLRRLSQSVADLCNCKIIAVMLGPLAYSERQNMGRVSRRSGNRVFREDATRSAAEAAAGAE